jgi:hypothetical protein
MSPSCPPPSSPSKTIQPRHHHNPQLAVLVCRICAHFRFTQFVNISYRTSSARFLSSLRASPPFPKNVPPRPGHRRPPHPRQSTRELARLHSLRLGAQADRTVGYSGQSMCHSHVTLSRTPLTPAPTVPQAPSSRKDRPDPMSRQPHR